MINDFNKLKTFIEVATEGSVSKAANKLYRTQSAITQQIKLLEEELDLPLFDRRNSRIYLTPEGEEIFAYAQERLEQITEFISSLKSDTKSLGGTIRIGVRPDIGIFNMPILIANFKKLYPNVNFQIDYGYAHEIESMLINNVIDFGILLFVKDKKLFDIHPLTKRNVILVGSKNYLEGKKSKTVKDILSLDFIDYVDDPETRAMAAWSKKLGSETMAQQRKLKASVICPDSAMMKALITSHVGIGHIQQYLVEDELLNGELIHLLPKKAKDFTISFDIAVRKTRSKTLIKEEFLQFVLNEMGQEAPTKN